LLDGILYDCNRARVCDFPDAPPQGPVDLPGFRLLPVVELDEPTPDGKVMAGHETAILADRVELWPVWATLPPAPAEPTTLGPVMSKYIFATRMLTPQEGMAIKALAKTDPQMEYAQDIYALAQEVDLRDPNVAAYLGVAEQAKILSADRVAQILAGIPVA